VVIDGEGRRLFSRRVLNDEATLTQMIADVAALGEVKAWAIDLNAGGAALAITLLINAGQARVRRDLRPMQQRDTVARDFQILTARRADAGIDHTREVSRLREQLAEYFPALERVLDISESKGVLVLLSGFATATALREISYDDLTAWLKARGVRATAALAAGPKRPRRPSTRRCTARPSPRAWWAGSWPRCKRCGASRPPTKQCALGHAPGQPLFHTRTGTGPGAVVITVSLPGAQLVRGLASSTGWVGQRPAESLRL